MNDSTIFVIGMHRSGTSLAMQALQRLGAEFGDQLIQGDEFNTNGYWEAETVVDFHTTLLSQSDRSWGLPEHANATPENWFESAKGHAAEEEATSLLRDLLRNTLDGKTLAIKDPRLTLFLPIWLRAAAKLSSAVQVVICLRNPAEVIASLQKRDKLDAGLAELYWLNYTASAIHYSQDLDPKLCFFQQWHENPAVNLDMLKRIMPTTTAPETKYVFEKGLAHKAPKEQKLRPHTSRLWSDLTKGRYEDTLPLIRGYISASSDASFVSAKIRGEIETSASFRLAKDAENYRIGLLEMNKKSAGDQAWIAEQAVALQTQEDALQAYRRAEQDLKNHLSAIEAERDSLLERANELLVAYQSVEYQQTQTNEALSQVEAERDSLLERANELLTAYQNAEQRIDTYLTEIHDLGQQKDAANATNRELALIEKIQSLEKSLLDEGTERNLQGARAVEYHDAFHAANEHARQLSKALETAEQEIALLRAQQETFSARLRLLFTRDSTLKN